MVRLLHLLHPFYLLRLCCSLLPICLIPAFSISCSFPSIRGVCLIDVAVHGAAARRFVTTALMFTRPFHCVRCVTFLYISINHNQSKVLTKPHTGRGEATSQHHHREGKPCITK